MHITYAARSRFFQPIEDVVIEERDALMMGQPIQVVLEPGGYHGHMQITIDAGDTSGFETTWAHNDPSRFPARIRAAATVLFQRACNGVFFIAHENGVMSISRDVLESFMKRYKWLLISWETTQ